MVCVLGVMVIVLVMLVVVAGRVRRVRRVRRVWRGACWVERLGLVCHGGRDLYHLCHTDLSARRRPPLDGPFPLGVIFRLRWGWGCRLRRKRGWPLPWGHLAFAVVVAAVVRGQMGRLRADGDDLRDGEEALARLRWPAVAVLLRLLFLRVSWSRHGEKRTGMEAKYN